MTIHISARMAWHDYGWNGCVCRNPKENTYCTGLFSFPGDLIAERRNLQLEEPIAGKPVNELSNFYIPCLASGNAFSPFPIPAQMPPPKWFTDNTSPRTWTIPPYTICTWPYEEVYKEEVLNTETKYPKYDPIKRRTAVNEYFSKITPSKSLIFYYANYSNPFSENEQQKYVIIGMSRIKSIGEEITWTDQSEEMERRYGPNVWMRNITSNYPTEGLRIPYYAYMDQPKVLERILFVPENPRAFKYASRHITDDGALALIEQMAEIVGVLIEIGDNHENWPLRLTWLSSLMAELWQSRGLYPGLLRVLDYLKFSEGIEYATKQIPILGEQKVTDLLFSFLSGEISTIPDMTISAQRISSVRKKWQLLEPNQQMLISETLPRFDLRTDQISRIIDQPGNVCILSAPEEISQNPYILCEQYIGLDVDDQITFNQIDHGMLPSPDLGKATLVEPESWQRLRALCVEQLRHQDQHTFLLADSILESINHKLGYLPEWKKAHFNLRYLEIDKNEISKALKFRYESNQLYLYLKQIFDDERDIESGLRELAQRQNIKLKFPMTDSNWHLFLFDPKSPLSESHPEEYEDAIAQQKRFAKEPSCAQLAFLAEVLALEKLQLLAQLLMQLKKHMEKALAFNY